MEYMKILKYHHKYFENRRDAARHMHSFDIECIYHSGIILKFSIPSHEISFVSDTKSQDSIALSFTVIIYKNVTRN